jgi:hypothetical protein
MNGAGKASTVVIGASGGIGGAFEAALIDEGASEADLAIRLRRAAFNRALAGADLQAIGPILAQNAILVAGTDSAVISGRKAQVMAWKREFAAPDRIIYTRIPNAILSSAIEPIALEQGRWQSVTATTGQSLASGTYSAKWRRIGADWMIEAEIFITLA